MITFNPLMLLDMLFDCFGGNPPAPTKSPAEYDIAASWARIHDLNSGGMTWDINPALRDLDARLSKLEGKE